MSLEPDELFVVRNHNGRLVAQGSDLGNVAEEMMFYEEMTGNRCTFGKETLPILDVR